jgi:hypothetical protein
MQEGIREETRVIHLQQLWTVQDGLILLRNRQWLGRVGVILKLLVFLFLRLHGDRIKIHGNFCDRSGHDGRLLVMQGRR